LTKKGEKSGGMSSGWIFHENENRSVDVLRLAEKQSSGRKSPGQKKVLKGM